LVHKEDVESVRNAWAETRATGKDYQIQYRVLWPDGSVHWLESQAKCQRNSDGRATRLVICPDTAGLIATLDRLGAAGNAEAVAAPILD